MLQVNWHVLLSQPWLDHWELAGRLVQATQVPALMLKQPERYMPTEQLLVQAVYGQVVDEYCPGPVKKLFCGSWAPANCNKTRSNAVMILGIILELLWECLYTSFYMRLQIFNGLPSGIDACFLYLKMAELLWI